jgi:hypothetical protein
MATWSLIKVAVVSFDFQLQILPLANNNIGKRWKTKDLP